MDYVKHFERNPNICGGELIVKGTRVPVKTLLASLADGDSPATIRRDFPTLKPIDISMLVRLAASYACRHFDTRDFRKITGI